ncbi:hypothetical protein MOSE0_B01178 [Monosporozyma servazzii]
MKLDSNVYSEAQRLARSPRFKYLMLGLVCSTVVPVTYARHYSLPRYSQQVRAQEVKEQNVVQSRWTVPRLMDDAEEENTYMLISSIL